MGYWYPCWLDPLLHGILQGVVLSLASLLTGAVANPVSYDLMKYVGAQALARLRDRGIRAAILRDTRQRLERYGLPDAQAQHLTQLVEDKQWLERGASLDVTTLATLVQTEMNERGYLPLEGDYLYRSLVESIAAAVGGHTFMTSLVTANFLAQHPRPINPASLFAFVDAMRRPETLGAELLAGILRDAGQRDARLAVNHAQKLELLGPYQLHFRGQGEAGRHLQDAVQRALAGETATLSAAHAAELTITAGHSVLDRLLGLVPGELTELELRPAPEMRTLRIRGPQGAEQQVAVELRRQPEQAMTLVFVDRPELTFTIRTTPTRWDWQFHFDLTQARITAADRNVLSSVRLLTSGRARVFDAQTQHHLFAVREDTAELRAVHRFAGLLVDLLDLDEYIGTHLGERVGLELDQPLTDAPMKMLSMAAQHARGGLVGEQITHTHHLELTSYWANFFSPGRTYWKRVTHALPYERGDLELTLEWRQPRLTFRDHQGRRLARARLPQHVGATVSVTLSGEVVAASIHRGEAGSRNRASEGDDAVGNQ